MSKSKIDVNSLKVGDKLFRVYQPKNFHYVDDLGTILSITSSSDFEVNFLTNKSCINTVEIDEDFFLCKEEATLYALKNLDKYLVKLVKQRENLIQTLSRVKKQNVKKRSSPIKDKKVQRAFKSLRK